MYTCWPCNTVQHIVAKAKIAQEHDDDHSSVSHIQCQQVPKRWKHHSPFADAKKPCFRPGAISDEAQNNVSTPSLPTQRLHYQGFHQHQELQPHQDVPGGCYMHGHHGHREDLTSLLLQSFHLPQQMKCGPSTQTLPCTC